VIGEISALGSALCWAISSSMTKSLSGKVEPLSLNFIRCAGAALVIWAILPFYPGLNGLSFIPADALFFLVFSALLGMSIGDTLYIRGLRLINVTLAFPIAQAVTPLLTVIAAVLFLREEITKTFILGTTLILLGIYLVAIPAGTTFRSLGPPFEKRGTGISLILVASLFWTVSIAFLKLGLQKVDPFLANGVRLPISAMALLPLVFFEKSFPEGPAISRPRLVILGAITGLLAFGIGGFLFLTAIRDAGAGKAIVLTSCAPLLGLPISVIFLKERVTRRIQTGTILVVLGMILVF
jgi:drug/metabolite transporter (DMT)-like permease